MTDDISKEFCEWLFQECHTGYTIIAHNFRSFDGHFILKYMLDNNLRPEVIKRGSQLLDLKYAKLNMKARDTLNFCALKLSNFPKAVGLSDLACKGEFPHLVNKPENFDKIIPFPAPEIYGIDGRPADEKAKFMTWWNEESVKNGGMFDVRKQLMDYCSNDVTVLRLCALKFRKDFIDLCKIDPFQSVTIASACQKFYRTYLLKEEEIAVISEHGYQANRKTSFEAAEWMEFLNSQPGIQIEHKRNGKEIKVGRYFVDGVDHRTKTAYEYNGCVFHGCPACQDPVNTLPFSDTLMKEAYEAHLLKVAFLERQGYQVETMWKCDWKLKRQEPDATTFISSLNLSKPLNIKEAFRGGRTNAVKLFHQVEGEEKIHHIDIVSLYPTVNKYEEYPIGHPEIIVSNFKEMKDYFGIAKCVIKCPPQDRFPVLPMAAGGKLVFALCEKCATNQVTTSCPHEGADRYIEGTWCTPEIHYAMENGYEVVKILEVWHWNQKRSRFFAEFVDKFLRIKTEASGWSHWCVDDATKQLFLDEVKEKEGITLDPNNMVSNPGLKAVAKLMLNSFWGKFGMRDTLTKTEFIRDQKKYYEKIRSSHIKIHDLHIVTDECVMLTTSTHEEFNEGNGTMAIAALTTSYARLRLLKMLRQLDDRVLYFDTDSVIYTSLPGQWEPTLGNILGDWDNQLEADESHITSFVSLGPKTYSYITNTGRVEIKAKSITQNGYTEDILAWNEDGTELVQTGNAVTKESFEELLRNQESVLKVIYPHHLKKDAKYQTIREVIMPKSIRLVYDKRILHDDFTTSAYGSKLF